MFVSETQLGSGVSSEDLWKSSHFWKLLSKKFHLFQSRVLRRVCKRGENRIPDISICKTKGLFSCLQDGHKWTAIHCITFYCFSLPFLFNPLSFLFPSHYFTWHCCRGTGPNTQFHCLYLVIAWNTEKEMKFDEEFWLQKACKYLRKAVKTIIPYNTTQALLNALKILKGLKWI